MSVVGTSPARVRFGGFIRPLEGVRGIASLLVIVAHVAVVTGDSADDGPGGARHSDIIGVVAQTFVVAVPIFCVMAGLLLYRQFVNSAVLARPMQSVRKYLYRRALRVLPLYWTLIVVAVFVAEGGALRSPKEFVRYLFFLQIYQKDSLPSSLVPTWTLASEAVFYLFLPVFAVLLARFAAGGRGVTGRTRRTLWGIGSLLVVNLGWQVYDHRASMGPWPAQYQWLPSLIGYFGAGMILAVIQASSEATPERPHPVYNLVRNRTGVVWLLAFVTGAAVGFPQLVGRDINTVGYPTVPHAVLVYLLNLTCAACVVAAVALSDHWPRFLSHKIPVTLGRLSYGTYLWHMVVLTAWLKISHQAYGQPRFWQLLPVVWVGAIVVSSVTYRYVELPGQRLKTLFASAPPPQPAFVGVGNGRVVRPAGRISGWDGSPRLVAAGRPVPAPRSARSAATGRGVPGSGALSWTDRGRPRSLNAG